MNLENREKWLKKTLHKIPKGSKILDAGAGELQYKKYCKHLDYVSQDFAQYNGEGDGKGLQTENWNNSKLDIVSDIIEIPVKKNSFDAVMCIEVLEHLPYPNLAIKEFQRILKKGGKLILTAPFCSLTHFAPYHFSSGFNKYWYLKILEDNGFAILNMEYNGNYFDFMIQELKRVSSIEKKYSKTSNADKYMFKLAKGILLKSIREMSEQDTGSNELLSFGIHILAEKKR
ncbi:MAG: class I SAM-dependent methyltransferase [Candidatus Dojkabacteria bacterium]